MAELMAKRHPVYAEADLVVDCGEESAREHHVHGACGRCSTGHPPRRLSVALSTARYDVVVGEGLLARAGGLLAPVLPREGARWW